MLPRLRLLRGGAQAIRRLIPAAAAQRTTHRFTSTAVALPNAKSPDRAASIGRLAFDASKAGLEKVDKAHVASVIQAATMGSAFYESEQRKEAERTVRHNALVAKQRVFRHLPRSEQQEWAVRAEAAAAALESTRDFSRSFIHIDLDMFYAAVEEKFNPSLRDRPFAVGSFAMLATSNYIARQYGVRSGMPGFIAKRLCPTLWIQPLHFDLYRAEAAAVRAIAATYDPFYVTVGLDELTMDVTSYLQRQRSTSSSSGTAAMTAADVCAEFRARVESATTLTCSGGISHTAAFAKLASNVHKPNGQHEITLRTRAEVLQRVRDIPVRDIPGIGYATEQQLKSLGILTCKDFLSHQAELCYLFREKTFAFYLSAGLGLVRTHVDRAIAERAAQTSHMGSAGSTYAECKPASQEVKKRRSAPDVHIETKTTARAAAACPVAAAPHASLPLLQKSTGKSITVSRGLPSPAAFRLQLRQLVRGAHDVLVQQGAGTRHISFSTIDHSFRERRYSTTLPILTASYGSLCKAAASLAEPFVPRHREFRLIGVNFGKLQRMPARSSSSSCATPLSASKAAKFETTTTASSPRHPKRRPSTPKETFKLVAPALSLKRKRTKAKASAASSQAKTNAKASSRRATKVNGPPPKIKHRISYVRHV
ncbi:putative DNA polymerase kappa [Leptomonas pyrrhocoris]|uniref:DNA polymerase kappa n=1 Tax=Leptomonas pyrrhocoris TaxID=157538 RepID=A0A0N1J5D2_LEPPY|nr:putative DNA polymerase kappa [Leptomonas pyrrhocoris]KPA85341.1 putative DNA polymerase kappa [Leptomonas pyrrhocoris]|eukprot:XP_015663780.1 putative DNA polymerase kappa [Leptomonas pyrrhocoris]